MLKLGKCSVALITALTFATPALTEVVQRSSGSVLRYTEIKSRRGEVVVFTDDFLVDNEKVTSAEWTVDCGKRRMVAHDSRGIKKVWLPDGNLWYHTTTNGEREENENDVNELYEFGCNGVIPANGKLIRKK